MKIWDVLTGRSRAVKPNLDSLFGVPTAAITLQVSLGLVPTGAGSVCFRAVDGLAFQEVQDDAVELIRLDDRAPAVEVSRDDFGFTWLMVRRDSADLSGLCTDLHLVNTTLQAEGFDAGLLCSLIGFVDRAGRKVGLVYLYKQGTFYAFAPTGAHTRDNLLEITLRDHLQSELPWEPDLQRWLALWGAPGL